MSDYDWFALAACKGMDTNLFFTSTSGPAARREAQHAMSVCARCPVVNRCAEYGRNDQYGIFGGAKRNRVGTPFRSWATA